MYDLLHRVQQALSYPPQARRMGWEGTVILSCVILKNGEIADAAVAHSSGFAALDRSALQTLKKTGPVYGMPGRVAVRLPVVFRLQ